VLSIEDLLVAKKTQREKDWLMIQRLMDAHFVRYSASPSAEQIRFWLRDSRTPAVLID
jgi:hypothetical protein